MKGCKRICGILTCLKLKYQSILPLAKNISIGVLLSVLGMIIILLLLGSATNILGLVGLNEDALVQYSCTFVIGFIALFTQIVFVVDSIHTRKTSYMPSLIMDFRNKDSSEDILHSDGAFQVTLQSDKSASNFLPDFNRGQFNLRLINHMGWAISLKNIGNGTAHSISLKVNNAEIFSSRVLEKGLILSGYCYVPTDMVDIDLRVVLTFQDMMNNRYVQEHSYRKNAGGIPTISLGKPLG